MQKQQEQRAALQRLVDMVSPCLRACLLACLSFRQHHVPPCACLSCSFSHVWSCWVHCHTWAWSEARSHVQPHTPGPW